MPKSIRLYLCTGLRKVGHIIYHQKATDEENVVVHIVEYNNDCATSSEGNKFNTYVRKAVDVIWKLMHYTIDREVRI